ncbi:MAG: hypothetical protein ACE5LU_29170 [Anaerolineae bacterium]
MHGDLDEVRGRILAGLNRLQGFQHADGLFSIWCGGKAKPGITARVAHRLSAYRGLPYPDADSMLGRATEALLKRKYRDNQLLPLDRRFMDHLATPKDAVALYFYGNGRRDEALDFLRRTVKGDGMSVHWEGKAEWGCWGGHLEATCDVARVMYDAGDPVFRPAFNYVGSKVVNGGLYSTADTRALVELLATIRAGDEPVARIDGAEVRLTEQGIGEEVTALRDNLIVRVDEEIVIEHLTPRDDFRFDVKVEPRRLKLGERTQVRIRLEEDSICPLARVYLPGCLALLKGGANAQTAHLPVGVSGVTFWRDPRRLDLDVVAVRRGKGQLRVAVHDLYDADKVGTAPEIQIIVD